MQDTSGEARTNFFGPFYMDVSVLVDQQELIYIIISVQTYDVAWKIYWEGWIMVIIPVLKKKALLFDSLSCNSHWHFFKVSYTKDFLYLL